MLFHLCHFLAHLGGKRRRRPGVQFTRTSISIGPQSPTGNNWKKAPGSSGETQTNKETNEKKKKQALTYGAVGSGPLVVADAGSRLGAEGAVIGALLGTSALEDLAADAPPARVAVALSVMTGSVTGARGVHAVHCGHTRTHTGVSSQTQHQSRCFSGRDKMVFSPAADSAG